MSTVLVLGGTGRTGSRVVEQLLDRGVDVRVIVRSPDKLPERAAGDPRLAVTVADLPAMSDEALRDEVAGCDAVISCLGHVASLRGVYGPPRDLVTQAVARVCGAIRAVQPPAPIRVVLMSSVSVSDPGGFETRRKGLERAFVGVIRWVLPPASDNQRAADFLGSAIGASGSSAEWVVIRPDTLLEGGVTPYEVHERLVSSIFRSDDTNMANVAHFACELVTNGALWNEWKGKRPVIVNAGIVSTASG